MKKSSSEQQSRIRKQFDSFCKTLLKNEMIDYERERNYRLKYEISFSELTQKELRQLEIMDDYIVESEMFHVFDYDIEVKDELIGEALKSLPEKKRNVILLSFFLDMTDTEIAKYMNLVRSTIHHHRTSSLIALKRKEVPTAPGAVPATPVHKPVVYDFNPRNTLSMVAEEKAPYGNKEN